MEAKEIYKIWKDTRYNPVGALWEISNYGRVKRNGALYECKLHKGYKCFSGWLVHRVVAELFIPNPENKPCVDHINTNPLDNRACNLRWVTPKENSNNPLTLKHISEAMKGKTQSEESNRKRSKAHKGKTLPEDQRRKISESLKGEKNPMWGKSHLGESKRKQSESHKNTHRVYHDDGTWHMEKNIIIN